MKKDIWPKRLMTPKLLIFGLVIGLALCFSSPAEALKDRLITGEDIYKHTTEGAVYGGVFRGRHPAVRSLDPHMETSNATNVISNIVYDGLVRLGQRFTDDFEPRLATSWRQIDDVTYEFKLREGVRFQNVPPVNGRELTSADVKYSIERVAGMHGRKAMFAHRYYFEDKLESIETPDKYTVIFKTKEPFAPFMNYIASAWTAIVPQEAVDEFGDLRSRGIGTGPFILTENVKGSHMSFEKNPNFWKEGLPYLDRYHIRIMPQQATAMAAFLAGELDTVGLDDVTWETVLKEEPDVKMKAYPGGYTWILRTSPWWEGKIPLQPPFDDKRVRQALILAIDKPQLLQLAREGSGVLQIGVVPLVYEPWGLPPEDQTEYNPEKAKKLLAEAGYPNGFSAELLTWNLAYMTKPAQIIQEMLGQVGINLSLNTMDFSQYFNRVYTFKYEMSLHISTQGYDPEEWLVPYFGDTEKATYYKWSNPDLHELIAKQATIMDREKRLAMIHDIQRKVMDEGMFHNLYTYIRYHAVKPYVHHKTYFHESSINCGLEVTWLEKR